MKPFAIPMRHAPPLGLLAASLIVLAGCQDPEDSAQHDSDIVHLTDANFAEVALNPETITLVDFAADWCPPCKRMEPHLEKVATEMKGRAIVARVDTDASQKTAKDYAIYNLPTLVVFKNGEEAIRRIGYSEAPAIRKLIESQLNAPAEENL